VLEHGDDFIKNGVFFVSLGFFFSIVSSLFFKIRDGLIKSVLGFLEDDVALGLLSKGSLNLSGKSVSINLLSFEFSFEPFNFSLG
jgi:hypothetical protein